MTQLTTGDPAPWFVAPSAENPAFQFGTLAGRWVALAFVPDLEVASALRSAAAALARDDARHCLFIVAPEAFTDSFPARCFADPGGAIARAYAVGAPCWFVLDPTLRVFASGPLDGGPEPLLRLLSVLPEPSTHAGAPLHAPVLLVPRVFEPEFCRTLIAAYDAQGGEESGFMREVDGYTRLLNDHRHKRRKDVNLDDPGLMAQARERIRRRLAPEIRKAFQFEATRLERYLVACYAADAGWFRPHRDNTTKGTAHRKFAVTINLNAEDYAGGDLRFPEFGARTYRPPTGGAVVFSCSLLHEATPVTAGERYAFLPFLYDEAGAKLRERNLEYVKLDTPRAPVTVQ